MAKTIKEHKDRTIEDDFLVKHWKEDKMETPTESRKEVKDLTEEELDDELQRPTDNWKEDVQREALRRILNNF